MGDGDVVIKGESLEGEVAFTDNKVIPNYDQIVNKLKIITINIWTT